MTNFKPPSHSDFHFKKKFGQNFISDPSILNRIAEGAQITPEDTVLEIGAGAGALTDALAQKAKQVITIEIDPSLETILKERFEPYDNVHLHMGDALKLDLDALAASYGVTSYKIVANLPYYITTPLIMHILEKSPACSQAVLMVQKEVGERLNAQAGNKNYGAITVMVQYYSKVELLFHVPRGAFHPTPNVDSSVLRLTSHPQASRFAVAPEDLRQVVRLAFGQRRKTLRNTLSPLALSPEERQAAFAKCGIDDSARGETLSLGDFVCLSKALFAEAATTKETSHDDL